MGSTVGSAGWSMAGGADVLSASMYVTTRPGRQDVCAPSRVPSRRAAVIFRLFPILRLQSLLCSSCSLLYLTQIYCTVSVFRSNARDRCTSIIDRLQSKPPQDKPHVFGVRRQSETGDGAWILPLSELVSETTGQYSKAVSRFAGHSKFILRFIVYALDNVR